VGTGKVELVERYEEKKKKTTTSGKGKRSRAKEPSMEECRMDGS